MADLMFYAFFIASKVGKTGLTVTVDIHRVTRSSGASSEVVTGGSMTEVGDGAYSYRLASADTTLYDYVAVAKTADTSVDQQHLAALWTLWGNALGADVVTAAAVADGAIDAGAIASNAITAAKIATGAIDADALAADAVAEIWSYATRTLTASSTGADVSTSAGYIRRRRGDSWSISITGLGALTGYTSIWFTIKTAPGDTDAQSIIQVKKNASGSGDGLLYVNGAAASSAALGSITIDDASAGNITVAIDETVTDDMPVSLLLFDVQTLITANTNTPTAGTFEVIEDITRSVA